MNDSLTTFMRRLIDYAGLFPPARLDLPTALRNYRSYRDSDDAWMLGRFILPAGRLDELAGSLAESPVDEEPLRLTLLMGGGATSDRARRRLADEAAAIDAFLREHGSRVRVEGIEARLPDDVPAQEDPGAIDRAVADLTGATAGAGVAGGELFLEFAAESCGLTGFEAVLASLVRGNAGFKLRCGGVTADAFPEVEAVACVLAACRDHRRPVKCTAGLHHPLRHHDEGVGTDSHGFLNVFGAGLLAHGAGLPGETIAACLRDTDASAFRFEADGFGWRDVFLTTEQIAAGRREMMIGFGSCSFDEPRDDLRRLGLLQ
jgi:hypothetical protein